MSTTGDARRFTALMQGVGDSARANFHGPLNERTKVWVSLERLRVWWTASLSDGPLVPFGPRATVDGDEVEVHIHIVDLEKFGRIVKIVVLDGYPCEAP